jgi:hypothetical protein
LIYVPWLSKLFISLAPIVVKHGIKIRLKNRAATVLPAPDVKLIFARNAGTK